MRSQGSEDRDTLRPPLPPPSLPPLLPRVSRALYSEFSTRLSKLDREIIDMYNRVFEASKISVIKIERS